MVNGNKDSPKIPKTIKIKMPKFYKVLRSIFRKLGPGFITGAADDDPSGVKDGFL
ncbi:MAG: hypothetical protein M1475_04675 [Actinobacteria bacterium]|nr:hypothetical protein [Actinomycetota bacterium]